MSPGVAAREAVGWYRDHPEYFARHEGFDHAHESARFIRLASSGGGGRVLDVGCASGGVLASLGGRLRVGLDVSPRALEAARRRSGAEVVAGDAARLPFADASFDTVCSNSVLEHLVDPLGAVAEMVRVARPGGRIVIRTNNELRATQLRSPAGVANFLGAALAVLGGGTRAHRSLAMERGFVTDDDDQVYDVTSYHVLRALGRLPVRVVELHPFEAEERLSGLKRRLVRVLTPVFRLPVLRWFGGELTVVAERLPAESQAI